MISIPIFDQIAGITVFRDDEDLSRFYYLPTKPTLARGEDGTPMFNFYRYQFPLTRTEGEPGGGYLVFTTQMREDQNVLDTKVLPVLQQRLRSENPLATNLPVPTLAAVDFSEGEARLIIMQNNQFVKAFTLGKPSLFGDNTVSVAIELSSDAATLFFEALKGGGSIGAIEYDLRFEVRLPAITIRGKVDSKEVKTAVMGYTAEQVSSEDTWGNEESHEVAHRSSVSETMESQGLVHLEILKGSVNLSQEDMESLRAFAFKAMDDFIKEHFLKGGEMVTEEDRKSQWMNYLHQDIHAHFDLDVTYRDVIRRNYNPSAQINPSFLGVPIEKVVMEIDLNNAPWYFNTLEVTIDTNLDFKKYGEIIHSVVGHLSYDQTQPDGTKLTKRDSFPFTANDLAQKKFRTRIAAVGKDQYHVEVEVNYKSGPTLQTVLDSFDTTTRNLTLNVPNPGIMEITFSTAPAAFDQQLVSVEVEVEYGDPTKQVPTATETIILDKVVPSRPYSRTIYAAWDKPYRYRNTFVLKEVDNNLQRSTGDWIEASSATHYVNIPTPFDQIFSLAIIPSVDWSQVLELVVDLEYEDAVSDYRIAETKSFSKETSKTLWWKFPLRKQDVRSFRYKQTLRLANMGVEVSEWKTQPKDGSVQVGNAPFGVVNLTVDPSDVDLGVTVRRAIVHLHYGDPANGGKTEALVFKAQETQVWTIARSGPGVNGFTFDVEYLMTDGTRRTLPSQPGTFGDGLEEFFFVPAPPPV